MPPKETIGCARIAASFILLIACRPYGDVNVLRANVPRANFPFPGGRSRNRDRAVPQNSPASNRTASFRRFDARVHPEEIQTCARDNRAPSPVATTVFAPPARESLRRSRARRLADPKRKAPLGARAAVPV